MIVPLICQPAPASSWAVTHAPFPAAEQWRCILFDRGYGTVLSAGLLHGAVLTYRVELDSGEVVMAAPRFVVPATHAAPVAA